MARFKRDKGAARGKMLAFRATAAEVEFLRDQAKARGLTLADLLREAIDAYLKRHARTKARDEDRHESP